MGSGAWVSSVRAVKIGTQVQIWANQPAAASVSDRQGGRLASVVELPMCRDIGARPRCRLGVGRVARLRCPLRDSGGRARWFPI